MMLRTLLFTIMVHLAKLESCPHNFDIKNGSSFTLHTSFKHTLEYPLEIRWLHNNQEVSMCTVDECADDYEEKTRTSINYALNSKTVDCEITVYTDRNDCLGVWSLKYLGVAYLKHREELYKCECSSADKHEKQIETEELDDFSGKHMLPYLVVIVLSAIVAATVIIVIIAMRRKSSTRKKNKAEFQNNLTQVLLVHDAKSTITAFV